MEQQTAIQLTPEVWDVMNLQGNLVAFFADKGIPGPIAQDLAAEAVHQFMISPTVKERYGSMYAALTNKNKVI